MSAKRLPVVSFPEQSLVATVGGNVVNDRRWLAAALTGHDRHFTGGAMLQEGRSCLLPFAVIAATGRVWPALIDRSPTLDLARTEKPSLNLPTTRADPWWTYRH